MKVMVIVKADANTEAGILPSEELMTAMGKYNEELVNAGIMLAGEGLQPSSKGARVRFSGKERSVIDGPFAETKELIAGFWMWRVNSMQEAIEWVKRCPNPTGEESVIEIRPLYTAEDFGDAFTPELLEQEAGLRAQTMGLNAPRFEDGKERIIAGIHKRYNMETRMNISSQWQEFLPQINSIPARVGTSTYGVSWDHDATCNFKYLSGVEVSGVDHLPAEIDHITIPASRYAVFTHTEHVSFITQTIDTILMKWAPDCELKMLESPSFIRHKEEFDYHTGMGGIEIWIPIHH